MDDALDKQGCLVLFELSGGCFPFATVLQACGAARLEALYFCADSSAELLIAATNFPSSTFLGRLEDISGEVLEGHVKSHPQSSFIVACALRSMSQSDFGGALRLVQILECLAPGRTSFVLGEMSPIRMTAPDSLRSHVFALQSAGACPFSSLSWWCMSSPPSWHCKTVWSEDSFGCPCVQPMQMSVSFHDCLCQGWEPVDCSIQKQPAMPWDHLQSNAVVVCSRTSRSRGLVAQEWEAVLGFSASHTAALLQSETKQCIDRKGVEAGRIRALLHAVPACIVKLVLQPFCASCGFEIIDASPSPQCLLCPQTDVAQPCGDVLEDLRAACPYLQDRALRNMPFQKFVGPDWADMHSHQAARLASCVQHKDDGFAVSQRRLLPYGLPPEVHVLLAEAVSSPFEAEVSLGDDLDFAVRTVVAEGTNIRAWRQRQWRHLCQHLRKVQPLTKLLEARRSPSSHRVSAHLSPGYLEALWCSIRWPDSQVATALCEGAEIVGELPTFGMYRKTEHTSPSMSCFSQDDNERWLQEVLQRKPPPPEEAQVVWNKSEAERQLGILEGWMQPKDLHKRFGQYQWRPMVRFTVWQPNHGAYRCIDNAKSSEHNLCTSAEERIHTTSVDMGLAICQRFRKLLQTPLEQSCALQSATKDMKRAYRQVPVHTKHLCFSVIAIWHPKQHKWVFGILHGLAFGLLAAVVQFNRFPALIVALARRWLAVPVINFFDDFNITEPAFAKASGSVYFDKLVSLLGWLFDVEKDRPASPIARFLGGLETYGPDEVALQPLPEREHAIKNQLTQAIHSQKLSPSDARTLSGKLTHLACFFLGRIGRGQTRALICQGQGATSHVSFHLHQSLQFYLWLLQAKPYRVVPLSTSHMRRRTIYTDASCETRPPLLRPVVQVSWLTLDTASSVAVGGFTVVPDQVLQSFQERSTYIAQGEAFGPLLALHFHAGVLACSHNILFIDNLGVLSALISGPALQILALSFMLSI